jgi:hypothetical protein
MTRLILADANAARIAFGSFPISARHFWAKAASKASRRFSVM